MSLVHPVRRSFRVKRGAVVGQVQLNAIKKLNVQSRGKAGRCDSFASPTDRPALRGCGRLNGGDHAQLIIELEERSVEQGPAHRSEAPAEAERHMGDPGPASAAAPTARPRSV